MQLGLRIRVEIQSQLGEKRRIVADEPLAERALDSNMLTACNLLFVCTLHSCNLPFFWPVPRHFSPSGGEGGGGGVDDRTRWALLRPAQLYMCFFLQIVLHSGNHGDAAWIFFNLF